MEVSHQAAHKLETTREKPLPPLLFLGQIRSYLTTLNRARFSLAALSAGEAAGGGVGDWPFGSGSASPSAKIIPYPVSRE